MGVIRRKRYGMTTLTVEVEPSQLEEAGWHFEDQCPVLEGEIPPGAMDTTLFRDGLRSLHRQAHPFQPSQIELCRLEPCASFPFAVLTGTIGHR